VGNEINEIRQREVFLEIYCLLLANDLTFRAKQLNVVKRCIVSVFYVRVWYKMLFPNTKMTMQTFDVMFDDFKRKR